MGHTRWETRGGDSEGITWGYDMAKKKWKDLVGTRIWRCPNECDLWEGTTWWNPVEGTTCRGPQRADRSAETLEGTPGRNIPEGTTWREHPGGDSIYAKP
jgi:hypothetical protein